MAEFTKGEWQVNEFDKRLVQVDFYDGENRFGIADCSNTGLLPEQELANAYLIASAPDMYEALKHAEIVLYNLRVSNLGELTQQQTLLEIEVKKTLAKAEGK